MNAKAGLPRRHTTPNTVLKPSLRLIHLKKLCHTCFKHGHIHSVRRACITDLPCIDRVVELEVETPQIRCPQCGCFRTVFCAETERRLQLTQWLKMAVVSGVKQVGKFARGIAAKFNEVINGVRYGINSGRIESANAGIQRIRSKCCGLFDIDWLLGKMRQIYLSRRVPYHRQI